MASTYLTRTISSGADVTAFTISVWLKRSALGSTQRIFSNDTTDSKDMYFRFGSDDTIQCYHRRTDSENVFNCNTNAKFRDTNGWYHIVMTVDSTESTASDRFKLYVNGESQTFSGTPTYPDASEICNFLNTGEKNDIGYYRTAPGEYFDGSMSHFHLIQGTAYQASTFGSTDSTTGEWKINPSPSVTYGTNGFFILKDGNSVTDQSGNSNNFTASGNLTNTEDNPSNVFSTMNPLSCGSNMTFGNGNTKIRNDVATWNSGLGTIAPGTGKYYWEVYVHGGGDNNTGVTLSSADGTTHSSVDAGRVVYSRNGYIYREGLSDQSNYDTGVTFGDTDIIGVAFDTENGTLSFYKNGSAVSNSTTTATQFLRSNNEYIVQCGLYNGGEFRFNFGNGYFGTSAISSEGTNASGIGKFEYDVPTGYTALCTKGLNE